MKLLLITRNFPPLLGGMERLNLHLACELAKYGNVRVVAPAGSAVYRPQGVEVTEVASTSLGRFLLAAMWQGLRMARRFRPEVVLAGSGLTAPMAWLAARLCGARAAVYLHGLDVATPHPLYRILWRPFLRRMDRVIANSGPTAELANRIGVPQRRMAVVPPGVNVPEPLDQEQRLRRGRDFRRRRGLGEGPLLLSVGRLTTRKGMLEFVRDVLPAVVARIPDARLAIIGGIPSKALAARAQTPEQILDVAEQAGLADRLHFLGEITEWDELQAAYLAADVHVFPVREIPGDPEGFGMVAIESAAHGLATVAYATGGVVDAVAEGVSGWLVSPGESADFARRVCELLDRPLPAIEMQEFAARFSWDAFGRRIREALN